MITESSDIFLRDLGVPVVWEEVSDLGFFECPDQVVGEFSLSTEYSITVQRSKFDGIEDGDEILVSGIDYIARGSPQKLDDGVFIKIILTKPD